MSSSHNFAWNIALSRVFFTQFVGVDLPPGFSVIGTLAANRLIRLVPFLNIILFISYHFYFLLSFHYYVFIISFLLFLFFRNVLLYYYDCCVLYLSISNSICILKVSGESSVWSHKKQIFKYSKNVLQLLWFFYSFLKKFTPKNNTPWQFLIDKNSLKWIHNLNLTPYMSLCSV